MQTIRKIVAYGFVDGNGRKKMNFYDKKVRRLVSIIILIVIVAMVATMVIPYLV